MGETKREDDLNAKIRELTEEIRRLRTSFETPGTFDHAVNRLRWSSDDRPRKRRPVRQPSSD